MDDDNIEVVVTVPETTPPVADATAAVDAANAVAAAAATVAMAAAQSPENRTSEEVAFLRARLDTIESILSGAHEKLDALMSAIEALATAEELELVAEQTPAGEQKEAVTEAAIVAADAASDIVAEEIPNEVVAETPQIRSRTSRRFV